MMAKSEDLRKNINQHKPKNEKSKLDDKLIYQAMYDTIDYLNQRFEKADNFKGYTLKFQDNLSYEEMISVIKRSNLRTEYEAFFRNCTIKPDGGVIVLTRSNDPDFFKIVLVSEVKRQGTNDVRQEEGKKKQSQGNAIERLGKNLTGIKAMLNHEKITPFVCFGWGCDFNQKYTDDDFVMAKISMLNEFYPLNKIYVHKKDGSSDQNYFSPTSMFFREEAWTKEEMFEILKEVGETSIRYYLF